MNDPINPAPANGLPTRESLNRERLRAGVLARLGARGLPFHTDTVEAVLAAALDEFQAAFEAGRRVELRGFGVFTPRLTKARVGRDPKHPERTFFIAPFVRVNFTWTGRKGVA
jgi:nucleoid DNA-binding protein